MARQAVEIPKVGLVMETVKLLRWLKSVGDTVTAGELLVEVESEKSIVEIEANVGGRLVEILVQPDDEVAVGAPIAWVENDQPEAQVATQPAAPVSPERVWQREPAAPAIAAERSGPRASPAARRLAREQGIDLSQLSGSGPGGRIQLEDVERAAKARPSQAPDRADSAAGARQPLSSMRRAVARAMTFSNAHVPQFAASRSVDWSEALEIRASLPTRLSAQAPKLSLNDFLLQAVARTLLELPKMNAVFMGDAESPDAHIVPASGAHIGLVVAVEDGLLVPVLHGVESLSLVQLAQRRADLVERALAGRVRREEMTGGTFTLSNLGAGGPDRFNALLNPPESGILAVGRVRDVPVAKEGRVLVRPVSELTLTVDHRLIDGKLASEFLARLVQILEGRDWRLE